jgi:heat-inducible transcriptional repressor
MDKRKEAILRAITDDYIETAEPVGSRTIARKYSLGVSPATIRNEMADLEESGYLQQPHTSAGRIPSDKGYRFYVDVLIPDPRVSEEEIVFVREKMMAPQVVVEEIIRRALRVLGIVTHYAAVAVAPSILDSVVRAVRFVPIDDSHLLAVVVTDPGLVQNRIAEVERMVPESLMLAGQRISARLRGKALRDVTSEVCRQLADEVPDPILYPVLMEMLVEGLTNTSEKVLVDGSINLIDHPEFQEITRAKALLSALEERERLIEVISRSTEGIGVSIGEENPYEGVRDCSVVSATYGSGGRAVGAVGVIGPTRMEYTRAIAMVQLVADMLSELLSGTVSA